MVIFAFIMLFFSILTSFSYFQNRYCSSTLLYLMVMGFEELKGPLKYIYMENLLSVASCVNSTLASIRRSHDYNDIETVARFRILISSLVDSPKELTQLSNEQLSNLGICMSCIMSSDFIEENPTYYQWSTGNVIAAVGFYAYMKQLDNSYLLNSHFPAFIVLMHQNSILQEKNFSVYNPFDLMNWCDTEQKKYDITKHFEYMLHVSCRKTGNSDDNLDHWRKEIEYELDTIEQRLNTRNTLEYAKSLYRALANSFSKEEIPGYCECD